MALSFNTTNKRPLNVAFGTLTDHSGYVYSVGGYNGGSVGNVYYAALAQNGSLGTWSSTTPLPYGVTQTSLVSAGGYLYALGGLYAGGGRVNYIYRCKPNGDGTITSWADTGTTSVAWGPGAVCKVDETTFIVSGGTDVSGNALYNVTKYVVNPSTGALTTTALTTLLFNGGTGFLVRGNYAYWFSNSYYTWSTWNPTAKTLGAWNGAVGGGAINLNGLGGGRSAVAGSSNDVYMLPYNDNLLIKLDFASAPTLALTTSAIGASWPDPNQTYCFIFGQSKGLTLVSTNTTANTSGLSAALYASLATLPPPGIGSSGSPGINSGMNF